MTDSFDEPPVVTVDVDEPGVDVFDEPPFVSVEIDPVLARPLRAPRKDARFPTPGIILHPILGPIENGILIFPELGGGVGP